MKIQIDEKIYTGSAVEIMEQLRQELLDADEIPDAEAYIQYLRRNYERMTGLECSLPQGNPETRAGAMLRELAEIGALKLWEEEEND